VTFKLLNSQNIAWHCEEQKDFEMQLNVQELQVCKQCEVSGTLFPFVG